MEKYADTIHFFKVLSESKMLDAYCNQNGISIDCVIKGLEWNENILAVMDKHNECYIKNAMEQEKQYEAPGYMTYREAALMFSLMPESDAAKAIKATVNYYLYGQLPSGLDGVAEKVFQIMRADIDRNNAKYQEVCKRNAENINKRWRRA